MVPLLTLDACLNFDYSVETESMEVNVLEKKVTLTFILPTVAKGITRQITPINRNHHLPKVAITKRLFQSSLD